MSAPRSDAPPADLISASLRGLAQRLIVVAPQPIPALVEVRTEFKRSLAPVAPVEQKSSFSQLLKKITDGNSTEQEEQKFYQGFPYKDDDEKAVLAHHGELKKEEAKGSLSSGAKYYFLSKIEQHQFNRSDKAKTYLVHACLHERSYPLALMQRADEFWASRYGVFNIFVYANAEEAVKGYLKIIECGTTRPSYVRHAHLQLGIAHRIGEGAKQDDKEAYEHFSKAAYAGCATAQHHLGYSFEYGLGTYQSYYEAVKWYRRAVENKADCSEKTFQQLRALFDISLPYSYYTSPEQWSSFLIPPVNDCANTYYDLAFGLANWDKIPENLIPKLKERLKIITQYQVDSFARRVVPSWEKVKPWLNQLPAQEIERVLSAKTSIEEVTLRASSAELTETKEAERVSAISALPLPSALAFTLTQQQHSNKAEETAFSRTLKEVVSANSTKEYEFYNQFISYNFHLPKTKAILAQYHELKVKEIHNPLSASECLFLYFVESYYIKVESFKSEKYLLKAVELEYTLALIISADLFYEYGENLQKAAELYLKAATHTANPIYLQHTHRHLGIMHRDGRGISRDDEKAAKHFHKAAVAGCAIAQYYLALRFHHGQGVTQDIAEAAYWYRIVAESKHYSHIMVHKELGELLENYSPSQGLDVIYDIVLGLACYQLIGCSALQTKLILKVSELAAKDPDLFIRKVGFSWEMVRRYINSQTALTLNIDKRRERTLAEAAQAHEAKTPSRAAPVVAAPQSLTRGLTVSLTQVLSHNSCLHLPPRDAISSQREPARMIHVYSPRLL